MNKTNITNREAAIEEKLSTHPVYNDMFASLILSIGTNFQKILPEKSRTTVMYCYADPVSMEEFTNLKKEPFPSRKPTLIIFFPEISGDIKEQYDMHRQKFPESELFFIACGDAVATVSYDKIKHLKDPVYDNKVSQIIKEGRELFSLGLAALIVDFKEGNVSLAIRKMKKPATFKRQGEIL